MSDAHPYLPRIRKELREAALSEEQLGACGIKIYFHNQMNKLRAEVTGPPDSPYQGGVFKLEMTILQGYPFVPPKVQFLTKIWHPNISSETGTCCFDGAYWNPCVTIYTLMMSFQAFLCDPEVDDPLFFDSTVARQYKDSPEVFKSTAQHWTGIYANGPHANQEYETLVQRLSEITAIDKAEARVQLSTHKWDLELATEFYLLASLSDPVSGRV